MITDEERAKLKVGDVVYWVSFNGNGYIDYFKYKIQAIRDETLICDRSCGGAVLWVKGKKLFVSEIEAIQLVISRLNEKIKLLEDYKNTVKQQLESLENGE